MKRYVPTSSFYRKIFCGMYAPFPGSNYSYNGVILGVMIKYFLNCQCERKATEKFINLFFFKIVSTDVFVMML